MQNLLHFSWHNSIVMLPFTPHQSLYFNKSPLRNHTEPFCRHSSTTKSFGPLRGGFLYFPREFAAGLPACNSSYYAPWHLENCISRLDLDTAPWPRTKRERSRTTPLQHRGRNADSVQAATTSKRHFYCNLHSQHWKPKSSLKVVSSFWTEKAISKYRPVATISKVEITSHWPVVLVGECLPQTLL